MNNILVIKLSALGDFIQALGAMAAIRNHHKDANITLLTTKSFKGFAEECGYFDKIIIDPRPRFFQPLQWLKLRKTLNDGAFDRVYDLQNNDRTGLYYKLFSKKPEWVGSIKDASHYNESAKAKTEHAFTRHQKGLALVGIEDVRVDPLAWMVEDIQSFDLHSPYVLLVPGCAPTRPEKRWPSESFAEVAIQLVKDGFQPVLIGTNDERDATQTIAQACPEALDLTSETSLKHIATLARHSAGAIGNDTGPMHLIGATGTPCLVLFSEHSDPIKHAPQGDHVSVLRQNDIADISVQDVLDAFHPRS